MLLITKLYPISKWVMKLYTPKDIAETFNSHFASVGENL